MKEASTVFLAAPVEQTLHMLDELAASGIKKKLLITDVGSTKQKVVSHAEKVLPDDYRFIGGHPMAGSHKSGVAAAKDFLFENAFYILTPSGSAGKEAVASLKDLLKGTNAKFVEMSPAEHDAVTSVISHFPHIVAASLVHQTVKFEDQYPLVKRFAAGGFRDITRIASSSPAMWRDILLHNKDKILERFDEWKQELDRIQSFVENEDADGLFEFFGKPRNTATVCLCGKKARFLPFTIFMSMSRTIRGYFEITAILADEQISITNIRIIETREDINGVLRISFQSDEDRKRAEKCIQTRAKYETFYAD